VLSVLLCGFFIQGCSNEDAIDTTNLEKYEEKIPSPLLNYFRSSDYSDFSKNFHLSTNNVDFENIKVEKLEDIDVVLYYLKINQGGENIGSLCVVSKSEGSIYKSLYEDISEMRKKNSGITSIYTSQGIFVANFNFEKESDGKYRMRLNDVASNNFPRLKGGAEWPTPADSWYTCLTKCYSYVQEACENDPNCNFLKDIGDIVISFSTLTMGASCAAYCAFFI
jgi:ribosomal protein S8